MRTLELAEPEVIDQVPEYVTQHQQVRDEPQRDEPQRAEPQRAERIGERPTGRPWFVVATLALAAFVALLAGVVAVGGFDAPDLTVYHDALAFRQPKLTALAVALTWLGAAPVVATLTAMVAGVLWLWTRQLLPPLALVLGVMVTASTVYLVKIAVSRARPAVGTLIGAPSSDMSFPSAHTSDGSVLFLLLALLLVGLLRRRWLRALVVTVGVTVAVAIGLSRIYLGYHWASDVLAGWCLATAVATAAVGLTRTAST